MRRKFIGYCVAALALYGGSVTESVAAGGSFTRGCAARDMQIMMMIETSAISSQQRSDAVRTIMHARIMCFEGQVMDALALYDDIAQSIVSAGPYLVERREDGG
jgi:hypothetical protein